MSRSVLPLLALVSLVFSLPSSAVTPETVAGHTAGQFQVNESGAAIYTVPITAVPGTSGIEPKLALSYSSQGRNSLLGVGWSLSGLSVISRCPATIAQDGFIDPVDFDGNDRFCLDGERLMAIAGDYGANGTEYRTEQDTFRRIISYGDAGGGPESFTVWTKAGLILEYGGTEDSRIEAQGKASALFWAVNRIADTKGNYLTVTYTEDNVNGDYRPNRIDYTANDAAGLAPYASVRFAYKSRPDITPRYVGGSVIKTTKRLAAIRTYEGETLYREYLLAYDTSPTTGDSRLFSLTECGSDGSCFSPTKLGWQDHSIGIESLNHGGLNIYTQNTGLNWLGDYDGDGLTDLASYVAGSGGTQVRVHYATGSGFTPVVHGGFDIYTEKAGLNWLGDYDGDGLTDLASYVAGSGGTQVRVHYSTGSDFTPAIHGGLEIYTQNTGLNWLGDYNGDGKTDLASYVAGSGGTQVRVHYSTGSGFTSAVYGGLIIYTQNTRLNWIGDYDGDGLTDLASFVAGAGSTKVRVHYSTGSGFIPVVHDGFDIYTEKTGLNWLGDYNGDGKSDLASYVAGSGGTQVRVNYSTVTGFIPVIHGGLDIYTQNTGLNWLGDYDGDGKTDLASYVAGSGGTQIRLHYSTGSGFAAVVHGGLEIYTQNTGLNWLGDYDGDGLTDLASYVAGSGGKGVRTHESRHPRQLLAAITTGHGMEISISYEPLTSTDIYTKDTAAEYPEQDFQGPMYVVSSYSTSNGIGGTSSFSYHYGGAKINLQGRGFRGFDSTTVTDAQTGIKTTIFYERDYRCISSKIRRTEQRQPDGTLISEVDNSFVIQDHGFGVHFSYVSKSVAKNYELDSSPVTTVTTTTDYDDYGNVLELSVDYGDGQTETTVNTYEDDLDNWFLGRLTRTEVTKTADGQPTQTRTSSFTYDRDSGLLTAEIIEPDHATLRLEKTYDHDAFGNIIASTTSGPGITSRTHTTTCDDQGRYVTESTNALAHKETKNYALGSMTGLTGPNSLTTTWKYDGFGRQVEELRADGTATLTFYELCDEDCHERAVYSVRSETTGEPYTVTYFDVLDREIRREVLGFDGTPIYTDTEYNARGLVERVSEPYFAGDTPLWTIFTYDLLGRATSETAPGNRITMTEYDGRTTTVTNPLGQQNIRTVDARGQLIASTDHLDGTITFAYDAFGNMVEMEDPLGNITTLTYNIRGNKKSITDPNTGTTTFAYNTLGELTSQTDARGKRVTLTYDRLGRMTSRVEPEGTSRWVYDTRTKGVGKLSRVSRGEYTEEYFYDVLGRIEKTRVTIGADSFLYTASYDLLGRPATLIYPSGFGVRTLYNAQGYAQEVRRTSDDHIQWRANTINARGQVEQATLGNGLVTTKEFDAETGRVDRIQTGGVQHLTFSYDVIGNLLGRSDLLRGLSETFAYDGLNRLTSSQVAGRSAVTVTYDALGNITSKSDVGTYTYGENGAGPHAVTSIVGPKSAAYTYDATGNRIQKLVGGGFGGAIFCDGFESGDTSAWVSGQSSCPAGSGISSVGYTSFNLPHTITEGDTTLTFTYGPEYDRYRQIVTTPGGTTTKLYIGDALERETTGGVTKDIHYIRAGGEVIAVHTVERIGGGTFETTRYLHRDHLGSVQTVTNEAGASVEVMSFDAWGLRRNAANWSPAAFPIVPALDRGFTGHEHLDEVSLIHMNGRVYDPVIGRFLSADPFVQVPEYSQSLNRYSYVLNNPLSLTDPSGFFSLGKIFKNIFRGVKSVISSAVSFIEDNAYTIVNAIGVITGHPVIAAVVISLHSGIQSGASFGDVLKDTISAAAIAAATVHITEYINGPKFLRGADPLTRGAAQIIAHGVVQGASRAAAGGKFEHGFLAGAVGDIGLLAGSALGDSVGAAVGSVVAAGTAEEIGGGKFANGALSAAMMYGVMRFGQIAASGRPLTTDEINEARKIYGDSIDYSRVKVFDGGYTLIELFAMAPDGNIYFPGDCKNLATCGGLDVAATFIHELAHVRQYQSGVNVLLRGLMLHTARVVTLGLYNPYGYSLPLDRPYSSYNIEQQGDIAKGAYYSIKALERRR